MALEDPYNEFTNFILYLFTLETYIYKVVNKAFLKNAPKNIVQNDKVKLIFASRYEDNCSSEDDNIITYVGNFFFTKLGQILFGLKITDILYTYVVGSTEIFKKLNIKNKDFTFCVELPIKAHKKNYLLATTKSNERARFAGKKKVSAFKDGFLILISMLKLYFK